MQIQKQMLSQIQKQMLSQIQKEMLLQMLKRKQNQMLMRTVLMRSKQTKMQFNFLKLHLTLQKILPRTKTRVTMR